MNNIIIGRIDDKKSDEKRTAYKINGKWFSSFNSNHTKYKIGDVVEINFSETIKNNNIYYDIISIKMIEKTLSTDTQIKRQVFLKLATDVVLKSEKINNSSIQKIVTIAKMIEEECKKQEYL